MRRGFWPLFLVSAAAIAFEIALTRYFAVAKWSEYGYWVISIAMAGFALSGVGMALFRDRAMRHGPALLAALPALLIAAAAGGYAATVANPFNPLQLQNVETYAPQLWDIALYYVEVLPFFALAGLYVSLTFVLNEREIGRAYGFDLTGAGVGAAAVLALMLMLHPFVLVPALLPLLALAGVLGPYRRRSGAAALLALGLAEFALFAAPGAAYNEFKAIYAPLHTPNAREVAQIRSPRGLYALLDDFTERVDTDVSNDLGLLHLPGPPAAYGLYRDGNRVSALPRGPVDVRYAGAALDALPYALRPHARVLLGGAGGGFRIAEAAALGAATIDASEPDPVIRRAIRRGLGPSPALPGDPHLIAAGPLAAARAALRKGKRYDLIDLSGDLLDAGSLNATAYTRNAIAAYLELAHPQGLVSIPVSIRELPVYAVRVLATVRAALLQLGYIDPAAHVIVYRSAWTVRVLVSTARWDPAGIAAVRRWCDDRSFDVSYYPGIDVAAARAGIYNDLPAVNFVTGQVTSGSTASDAVADEAGAVLAGERTASSDAFRLDPVTLDRPTLINILRLDRIGAALSRIDILPQAEIGQLVNVAVLAQAAVIALAVLLLPLAVPRVAGPTRDRLGALRAAALFAVLGLGFLFIEITLIARVSLYLGDRTSAFALVLTGMLVFSGLGSMGARRAGPLGAKIAAFLVVAWCVLALFGLEPLMLATLSWPWAARAAITLLVIAPVSLALGLPFPAGLAAAAERGGGFLPWAWALNGAFSVVATPLANLLAIEQGFDAVLLAAAVLYGVVILALPQTTRVAQWQTSTLL